MVPDQNEYRVIAPISKNNTDLWCVWAYTCNGDYDDWIYKFAYADHQRIHRSACETAATDRRETRE